MIFIFLLFCQDLGTAMGVKRGCLMILIREHADYKVKGREGYQCGGSGSLWIRICQGEIRNLEEVFFVFFKKAIDLTIFLLVQYV